MNTTTTPTTAAAPAQADWAPEDGEIGIVGGGIVGLAIAKAGKFEAAAIRDAIRDGGGSLYIGDVESDWSHHVLPLALRSIGGGFRAKRRSQSIRARLLSLIRGNSVRPSWGSPRNSITSS